MFIVRFIRNDSQPNEEYYYNDINDAQRHLELFLGDDSKLYKRIELLRVDKKKEELISYLIF